MNYLLILATAKLSGEPFRRLRLAAAAAFGALYAAAVFFPGMGFLLHPLCKVGAAVIMILMSFGSSRRLLRVTLVFFGLSCAFGGGILAIGLLGGRGLSLKNGILYSAMDLRIILLSAAACYVLLTVVFQRVAQHDGRTLAPAVLLLGERRVTFTTLIDTGNTLTDPLTGRTVMVADATCVADLFPDGPKLQELDLKNPVAAMERIAGTREAKRFRLLPYQAVGVECGMLLAVRLDGVQVGLQDYGSILVALSPTKVSDGGSYCALIGSR